MSSWPPADLAVMAVAGGGRFRPAYRGGHGRRLCP